MKRYFTLLPFFFLGLIAISQETSNATKGLTWVELYNAGLSELKNNNYVKADSFLTAAINAGYRSKDTYSNRAAARKASGNSCGYFVDLAFAAKYGDKEANTTFWKTYQTTNTVLTCTKNIRVAVKDTQALLIEYDSLKNITRTSILNLHSDGAFGFFSEGINRGDTAYSTLVTYERPKYPKSEEDMFRFIAKNTRYPQEEKEKNIEGKVFVEFTIDTDGSLKDIGLYKGAKGGPGLDQEALRVVKSMPKWTPGKFNDKAVKVQYILPFHFRLK